MKIKSRTFANFLSVVTIGYVVLRGVTISDILSEKFSDGAVWIEERYDLMLLLPLLVSSFINLFYRFHKEQILQKLQALGLFLVVVISLIIPYTFTTSRYEISSEGFKEYSITNEVISSYEMSEAKEINLYFRTYRSNKTFNYEIVFNDGFTYSSAGTKNELWWSVFEEIDKTLRTNNTPRYVYRPYLYDDILEYGYDDSGVFEHQQIVENMLDGALTVPS